MAWAKVTPSGPSTLSAVSRLVAYKEGRKSEQGVTGLIALVTQSSRPVGPLRRVSQYQLSITQTPPDCFCYLCYQRSHRTVSLYPCESWRILPTLLSRGLSLSVVPMCACWKTEKFINRNVGYWGERQVAVNDAFRERVHNDRFDRS